MKAAFTLIAHKPYSEERRFDGVRSEFPSIFQTFVRLTLGELEEKLVAIFFHNETRKPLDENYTFYVMTHDSLVYSNGQQPFFGSAEEEAPNASWRTISSVLPVMGFDQLIDFLGRIGWKEERSLNPDVRVWLGGTDAVGQPIRVVLPRSSDDIYIDRHIAKAVNLLSAMGFAAELAKSAKTALAMAVDRAKATARAKATGHAREQDMAEVKRLRAKYD